MNRYQNKFRRAVKALTIAKSRVTKVMAKLYGLGSGYPYLWAKGSLIRKEYFIKQDTSLGLHFLSGY